MKRINKKMKLFLALLGMGIVFNGSNIHAAGFDGGEAKSAVLAYTEPITTWAMGLIPITTAVVILISGLSWLTKDEDEQEQKPFKKILKKILIVAIILECVPVLLRIFGIS